MKLTETYKKIITEQKWWDNVKDSLSMAVSPVIGSAMLLKKSIDLYRGPNFDKVRLIFPLADWEVTAVTFLQKLGIVTGVYTSLEEAKRYVGELVKKGVKPKEIVIGSHGPKGGDSLLTTKKGESFYFDNSFLNSFKPLVQPGTKVFFTACYGADSLVGLKDAADKLGTTVYGASGVYNYVTNTAGKGFYWCSAKDYEVSETEGSYEPYKFNEDSAAIEEIIIPGEYEKEQIKVTVTVKDGTFPVKVPPFVTEVNDVSWYNLGTNSGYDNSARYGTMFTLRSIDTDIARGGAYNEFVDLLKKKGITMDPYQFFQGFIKKKIQSGDIKIMITAGGRAMDLMALKPLAAVKNVDNEYLLKNKLCGRVNKAPISWL